MSVYMETNPVSFSFYGTRDTVGELFELLPCAFHPVKDTCWETHYKLWNTSGMTVRGVVVCVRALRDEYQLNRDKLSPNNRRNILRLLLWARLTQVDYFGLSVTM